MLEPKTKENDVRPGPGRAFLERRHFTLPDLKAHCLVWLVAGGGLALDLWSKSAVFDWLKEKQTVTLVPGVMQLVLAENPGAAFGIAAVQYHFLIIVSIIALVVIIGVYLFGKSQQGVVYVALGLFAAGVSGNLWDRLFKDGRVRDFIDVVYWPGKHWPAFNVADAMLCVGVGLLIISTLFTGRSCQRRAQQHK